MSNSPRLGPQLALKHTQRLALTATLGASIQLLRVDAAGLTKYLEDQAAANPHLRLDPAPAPGLHDWLPRWRGVLHSAGMADVIDQSPDAAPGLMAHVAAAVAQMRLTPPEHRIAVALIDALEPSGWLGQPLDRIAAQTGVSTGDVDLVLRKLQKIDPPGLFARNLAECLLLQAKDAGVADAPLQMMLKNLDLLASGDLVRLSKLCGVSEAAIMTRFCLIRSLNPKPGADFAPMAAGQLREPDLILRESAGGGWKVALNRSALPDLHVDPTARGSADQLTAARALHRMVHARNATLLQVAGEIVARQLAALDQGPTALLPMGMEDIAQALGMHKSTISRVVAGASIDTPRGTWWLRKLFSVAVGGEGGAVMAGAALRHRLMRLIGAENPAAPLSDADLAVQLTAQTGVPIARRTVTKYRKDQAVPAAGRRKRQDRRPLTPGSDPKGRTKG